MALDAEPFALVEREGFKNLISHLAPKYELPSRKYFSETIIPTMYEDLKKAIETELQAAKNVSFTTDIWTSATNNESFISLTAHFIDPKEIVSKSFVLCCQHFPESHTGDNIGEVLNSAIEQWNLKPEKVHLIVSDNAANMCVGTGE